MCSEVSYNNNFLETHKPSLEHSKALLKSLSNSSKIL